MINFSSRKWFEEYLVFRKRYPINIDLLEPELRGVADLMQISSLENPRHSLYNLLQNSGLAYGFPVQYPFQPGPQKRISIQKSAKLILIDTLIYIIFQKESWSSRQMPDKIEEAGQLIQGYYRGMNRFSPHADEDMIEKLLLQRIAFKRSFLDFRRSGINSHLFWDLYFFQEFMNQKDKGLMREEQVFENLFWRKKKMKIKTMQLIAAAVHSDRKVTKSEKVLQHHFKRSARYLSRGEKDRLQKQFQEGVNLDYINIPELTWLGRRYLLDVSMLTLYADKHFDEMERQYAERLLSKLQLNAEDLYESQFQLGCFLMQYGKKLNFYNNRKNSVYLIAQAVSGNMKKLRTASYLEYEETVEMAAILGKLLKAQLGKTDPDKLPSEEEIAYALEQIKDLPRFLPFFSVIFMPVPGITELYILLACSIERLTGDNIKLLPSQFSKIVKGKGRR